MDWLNRIENEVFGGHDDDSELCIKCDLQNEKREELFKACPKCLRKQLRYFGYQMFIKGLKLRKDFIPLKETDSIQAFEKALMSEPEEKHDYGR